MIVETSHNYSSQDGIMCWDSTRTYKNKQGDNSPQTWQSLFAQVIGSLISWTPKVTLKATTVINILIGQGPLTLNNCRGPPRHENMYWSDWSWCSTSKRSAVCAVSSVYLTKGGAWLPGLCVRVLLSVSCVPQLDMDYGNHCRNQIYMPSHLYKS